eukprot:354296-Chlamydomonas_euryale.AAC.8
MMGIPWIHPRTRPSRTQRNLRPEAFLGFDLSNPPTPPTRAARRFVGRPGLVAGSSRAGVAREPRTVARRVVRRGDGPDAFHHDWTHGSL